VSAAIAVTGLTIDAARRALSAQLKASHIETPDLDARLLIGAALGIDHTALAIQAMRTITRDEATAIALFAERRIAHEPVARILGRKEFWGLDLELSGDTLVPRPDTETIVEAALESLRSASRASQAMSIADIGTGTGAILLALLTELDDATGVGTDISAGALATAEANARRLGLANRALFVRCDFAAALSGPFDLIVSNPPYIRSGDMASLEADVRDHDPHLALDGGADGLAAYRAIVPQAMSLLRPGGVLVFEVGHDQSGEVAQLMQAAGFVPGAAKADLGGIPRAVLGRKPAP